MTPDTAEKASQLQSDITLIKLHSDLADDKDSSMAAPYPVYRLHSFATHFLSTEQLAHLIATYKAMLTVQQVIRETELESL